MAEGGPGPEPEPEPPGSDLEQSLEAIGGATRPPGRFTHVKARALEKLEPYERLPLIDIGVAAYRRDRESAGAVLGSAIAFRLFLFFVPLLLFLVGLAGFVSDHFSSAQFSETTGVSGGLAGQIQGAFSEHGTARWIAVLFGLFGMLTAGRSLSKALLASSALAWHLPTSNKASLRVVGSVAGVIFGIGLVASVVNRVKLDLGYGVATLSFLPVLVVYLVAWLVVSLLLPRGTEDPGAVLPGSILVALTISGMQAASQLYLPDNLDRANQLYGAIGTTLVTLGWFFILGRAIVLAMVINPVIYEKYGSVSTLVFSLPVLRILPRRSAKLRAFFDLELKPKR